MWFPPPRIFHDSFIETLDYEKIILEYQNNDLIQYLTNLKQNFLITNNFI